MNRKQFLILLVGLVVLGGLGLALLKREEASWQASGNRIGQHLLKNFQANDVASLVIRNANGEVNLTRKDNQWEVKERGGYPADFRQIGDLLLKIQDFKILQSESVSPGQRPQLDLLEPGKGEKSGTLLEMKDQSGKVIAALVLGKKYLRSNPGGGAGYPAGRYILVSGDEQNVAVVGEPLLNVEPKPQSWMSKDFIQVDKLKSITATGADGAVKWKVLREKEGSDWVPSDLQAAEEFDKVNGTSISNAFSGMTFSDIAVNANAADTGLDQPTVVTAETFDNLSYTLKIGKEAKDSNRYVSVAVSGEPNKVRTPGPNEKAEDKEKLDKEFNDKLQQLEARVKREKTLTTWTYLMPNWKVDPLLKERAQLMVEKNKEGQPPPASGPQTE